MRRRPVAWSLAAALAALAVMGPAAAPAAKPREGRAAAAGREAERARLTPLLAALWESLVSRAVGVSGAGADWAEADRRQAWARLLLEAEAGRNGAPSGEAAGGEAGRERPAGRPAPAAKAEAALPAFDAGVPPLEEPTTFAAPLEGLGWPAGGRVAASFAPGANPPRQGLVLAVPEGSAVTASAGGEVVFSGALRGLGRIVIVDHGGRRHTVYGCLGRVDAREGDLVRRGDRLGASGLCGVTKSPGVYFELRFREKALNPAEWLAERR
ncbi:peptidoglycan DD-metalloendopeptidase family protein [Solidesulfovibrio sp.]|uniref:murein hydrolase activator EnvC family protein n=1 Tax=Solidesulfovibrio sp. TaxID=2910990 RepID=UPI00261B2622|nr:peptidoglycan DD-metalloendopeptidase family protein [Solidesulfovibrio sp.]